MRERHKIADLSRFSEIWYLGEEYRRTYQEYVKKGHRDARATNTTETNGADGDETLNKKRKLEESWENVLFIRTNFNDSEFD